MPRSALNVVSVVGSLGRHGSDEVVQTAAAKGLCAGAFTVKRGQTLLFDGTLTDEVCVESTLIWTLMLTILARLCLSPI